MMVLINNYAYCLLRLISMILDCMNTIDFGSECNLVSFVASRSCFLHNVTLGDFWSGDFLSTEFTN